MILTFFFSNITDASVVSQPPINPPSYANPNQLAQHVNKMSLQDEQYHPNSQFAPPLVSILHQCTVIFHLNNDILDWNNIFIGYSDQKNEMARMDSHIMTILLGPTRDLVIQKLQEPLTKWLLPASHSLNQMPVFHLLPQLDRYRDMVIRQAPKMAYLSLRLRLTQHPTKYLLVTRLPRLATLASNFPLLATKLHLQATK